MHKITRISYNSKGWQRPTGDARKYEASGTYNHEHGFGHEDWLFRNEWLIDGWRYAFIQGVNKSHSKLLKAGQPIDLTLFTIEPDRKRRFVATLHAVECLNEQQATDALAVFKQCGWHGTMQQEIQAVQGNVAAFGDQKWAKDVLNVRFRLSDVTSIPPGSYAKPDGWIKWMNRYQLYDAGPSASDSETAAGSSNPGTASLPQPKPYLRRGTAPVECTPEHARMQEALMKELAAEFPDAKIRREQDYIDVRVETEKDLMLFEIKSDLDPRTVIRLALGQILEYAYHPDRKHSLPVTLVIVGRQALSNKDKAYLDHLKMQFMLPLVYRVVKP